MAKFNLNKQENLIKEVKSNYNLVEKGRYIYWIFGGILLAFTALFLYAAKSQSEEMYYILVVISLLGALGFFGYSFYLINKNQKLNQTSDTYYITDKRLVIVDYEGNVKREILLTKIKKIEVEKLGLDGGYIYINKKLDMSQKARVKSSQTRKEIYTTDTIVLIGVSPLEELRKLLTI